MASVDLFDIIRLLLYVAYWYQSVQTWYNLDTKPSRPTDAYISFNIHQQRFHALSANGILWVNVVTT